MKEKTNDILQLHSINLSFGDHTALRDVNLNFERGKIHGLFGLNGAGKTVLINLIAGICTPNSGKIIFEDQLVSFQSPVEAMRAGIGSVLQEDTLVDTMTVEENLLMQEYALHDGNALFFCSKERKAACQAVIQRLGIQGKLSQSLQTLNYGTKQMIKLGRTILSAEHYRLLVMDEPCSGCSFQEEARLYQTLEELRDNGYTIIFATHHIEKTLQFCDTVTVLNDAMVAMHRPAAETTYAQILYALSNGSISRLSYPTIPQKHSRAILTASNITTKRIENVSFSLHKGEILGISGLLGSGRTGIARAIVGLDPLLSGSITFNREQLITNPCNAHCKIGFLPSGRDDFLEAEFPVSPNITMSNLRLIQKVGFLDTKKEARFSFNYRRKLNIMEPYQNAKVKFLSAGNQKKVLLSRLLFKDCTVLILDDPTDNIDILSRNEIYNLLNTFVLQGNSVILISSNVEELSHCCSRVLITKSRTIVKEIPAVNLTYEELL